MFIDFIKYHNHEDCFRKGIIDWNHIYQIEIPDLIKNSYSKIDRPILKSYVLLSRIKDHKLRKLFSRCFPVNEFIKQTNLNLKSIPGFLPRGVLGYKYHYNQVTRKERINCNFSNTKGKITFYNYDKNLQENFIKFFSKSNNKLPLNVVPKVISLKKLIDRVYKSKDEFIVIMGTEASKNKVYELFKSLVDPPLIILSEIGQLKSTLNSAESERPNKIRNKLYKTAHRLVLESGYIIPLGQMIAIQYYPKWIKNVRWLDRGQGFPQIDLMTIKR